MQEGPSSLQGQLQVSAGKGPQGWTHTHVPWGLTLQHGYSLCVSESVDVPLPEMSIDANRQQAVPPLPPFSLDLCRDRCRCLQGRHARSAERWTQSERRQRHSADRKTQVPAAMRQIRIRDSHIRDIHGDAGETDTEGYR